MKQWPPNYLEVLNDRYSAYVALHNDPSLQKDAMLYYKTRPAQWIIDFCITYDPRNVAPIPRVLPFVLFKRQIEFIDFLQGCLWQKESGLIEKARDVGASWLACAYSAWLWIFWPETAIGWGSRKEEYVDKKGDMKAIFPKIRKILENLPHWMLPKGFNMDKDGTYMKIINPINGANITGEAGDNIGRGGRTSIYFKDESAHYEHPESIEAALGDNTEVQIDISSVNGSNNVFYRRRMAGQLWYPEAVMEKGRTRVFVMDWRDHPNKTQEWYDQRRKKAESEGLLHMFAQEVDRDYTSAVDRIIIENKWVRAAIDAHLKLKFNDSGEKIGGQDVADEGGDKNALALRHGIILKYADHWGGEAGEAAKRAVPLCAEYGISQLYYDIIGVGAGFKTGINNLNERGALPDGLSVFPWNAGASPLNPDDKIIEGDYNSATNEDFFGNLKAQAWWSLRTRFYKTYRAITYGEVYPWEELISLPSNLEKLQEIIMELSQAVHKYNLAGKTIVDKKPEGARSPNLADAIVMCYFPARSPGSLDPLVLGMMS